jgi:hypothetical protein
MFKSIDMATGNHQIRQAFKRLVRVIQTELEHKRVYNESGSDMVKGDIVYCSGGVREVGLALADTEAHADWVGVMSEPAADGESGIARTEGYALVRFEDNLTLVSGTDAYVSASEAGAATNVLVDPGNFASRVGIIGDHSNYVGNPALETYNPFAYVFLGHCCGIGEANPDPG